MFLAVADQTIVATAMPSETFTVDIHCVTTWSKLGTVWEGVTIDDLLAAAGLDAGPALGLEGDLALDGLPGMLAVLGHVLIADVLG